MGISPILIALTRIPVMEGVSACLTTNRPIVPARMMVSTLLMIYAIGMGHASTSVTSGHGFTVEVSNDNATIHPTDFRFGIIS